jgi:NADH:ubiquinone oxidoreductase subunit C
MFKSLKQFIDLRLGKLIVLEDFYSEYGHFLKIHSRNLLNLAFFLKNDPDTRLVLLEQILAIPQRLVPWPKQETLNLEGLQIIYQLSSIKLPYQINVCIDYEEGSIIPSLRPIFQGAVWLENDIANTHQVQFEMNVKDNSRA